jgi:hypothetical protein
MFLPCPPPQIMTGAVREDSNPQDFMEPKRDPHHVLDDAVLAAGVHALQHYEQRPIGASVKAFLQLGELLDISSKHSIGGFLVEIEGASCPTMIQRRSPVRAEKMASKESMMKPRRLIRARWVPPLVNAHDALLLLHSRRLLRQCSNILQPLRELR